VTKRGGNTRAVALSTTSTLVVLGILLALFLLAPGSARVRETFFNPADMWDSLIGDPRKGCPAVSSSGWRSPGR
jgi:hypothetical protein